MLKKNPTDVLVADVKDPKIEDIGFQPLSDNYLDIV
jgi:hypothetical protein